MVEFVGLKPGDFSDVFACDIEVRLKCLLRLYVRYMIFFVLG
jgi:hypothetical protein